MVLQNNFGSYRQEYIYLSQGRKEDQLKSI